MPEGLIEFIPEMSVLIREINNLLAKDEAHNLIPDDIRNYVLRHLTFGSQALFSFLP